MQDRFKFRVWDKPTGQMFYDVALGFIKAPLCEDWVCVDTPEGQISYTGLRLNDIEIMQCTGLKDKHGKLIYESDVVRYTSTKSKINPDKEPSTENFKVVWEDTYTGYNLQNAKGVNCLNLAVVRKQIEVIGNSYINPDLLEVRE